MLYFRRWNKLERSNYQSKGELVVGLRDATSNPIGYKEATIHDLEKSNRI
jgi:hypothetical protein